MATWSSRESLPFILFIGTLFCDGLINLVTNDVAYEVQQQSFIVTRFVPYMVLLIIAILWFISRRKMLPVPSCRKYLPFMLIFGTALCDIVVNLLCNDISYEVQQQTFVLERFVPYLVFFSLATIWFLVKCMAEKAYFAPEITSCHMTRHHMIPVDKRDILPFDMPWPGLKFNRSTCQPSSPDDDPEMGMQLIHGLPPSPAPSLRHFFE